MSDFNNEEIVTCRKPRKCLECNTLINKGDLYVRKFGVFDSHFYSEKMCLICSEAKDSLFEIRVKGGMFPEEAGVCFGDLAFEIQEELKSDPDSILQKYKEHFKNRISP